MSKTIAIDIGHGVNTFPPNKGVYKNGKPYAEHDFNSKVGVELDKLLKHNGFKTVMRQKPYTADVPLITRTNYYNSQGVDLVWSIHANAGTSKVSGCCAFYWHTASDAKKLAQMFIDEVKAAGFNTHGNGLHASQKGSWTDLHICRETNMLAVLTENGFMTNDHDFEYIFGSKQKQYVKDIAKVHAKAICRYYGVKFKDTETVKPSSKPVEKPKEEVDINKLDAMEKELAALKKVVAKKQDKPGDGAVDPTHADNWSWAKEKGLLNGKNPQEHVTREQLGSVSHSFYEQFIANPAQAEEYAAEAFKWAKENDISDASNPAHVMSRQQGITIVHRAFELLKDDVQKMIDEATKRDKADEIKKLRARGI